MYFYIDTETVDANNERIVLFSDNWNDWYEFRTLFSMYYYSGKGDKIRLGTIKIGQKGLNADGEGMGEIKALLPKKFEELHEDFFSLGQGEDYYQSIRELGEDKAKNIFTSLNDVSYNKKLFNLFENERVMFNSLMRDIPKNTILMQYHRIANGGAKLTKYNFSFKLSQNESAKMKFSVNPDSCPPTNIHAIIGQNGVGKTQLLKNMVRASLGHGTNSYFCKSTIASERISAQSLFTTVVAVAFSAFDTFPESTSKKFFSKDDDKKLSYTYIGLPSISKVIEEDTSSEKMISEDFCSTILRILPSKFKAVEMVLSILEYDVFFENSNIFKRLKNDTKLLAGNIKLNTSKKTYIQFFDELSSGHKIIFLTLVKLIDNIHERSLVIIDEPETHLHPPLLASFMRALSEILISKNAIALIATHSPIVLQEIPRNCAYRMTRSGESTVFHRLNDETYGRNINSLMRDVFSLELNKTGFYRVVEEALLANDYDLEKTIDYFDGDLGDVALSIIYMLSNSKGDKGD